MLVEHVVSDGRVPVVVGGDDIAEVTEDDGVVLEDGATLAQHDTQG